MCLAGGGQLGGTFGAPAFPLGEMPGDDGLPVCLGGALPRGVPGTRDLLVIGAVELGVARMIAADRLALGLVRREQAGEEARRVGGIRGGIERGLEIVEGIGVIVQVDLHAADIDVPNAARLESTDVRDGLGLGWEETSVRSVRDGPRPGKTCPFPGVPAPRLDGCDGGQEFVGNVACALLRLDCGGTNFPCFQGVGRGVEAAGQNRQQCGSQSEQPECAGECVSSVQHGAKDLVIAVPA